jgi:hypothetical protein
MNNLIEHCYRQGWTDGLPVVPPTEARVSQMLGSRSDQRDVVVAVLDPSGSEATLGNIAANAVMAGCLPAYLPIVEAAVRAVADPRFNLDRVMTTASSQTPVLLVSGPVAAAVGMSGSWEALGSPSRANATIGRALLLVLRNIASHAVGGLDHATLGHSGKYSYCLTENLDSSPWGSWHVDRGAAPEESIVAVFPGEAPLCIIDMGHDDADSILRTIAESMAIPGTYNAYFRQDLWLVLSPDHARILAAAGLSRADVAKRLYEHARLPRERLEGRGLYGYIDELLPPTWLDGLAPTDPVAIMDGPDRLTVLVAGGDFGGYSAAIFGEGVTVTAPIHAASGGPRDAKGYADEGGKTAEPDAGAALVDPTAARHRERATAPPLQRHGASHVGLVDGTLNKSSLWGQGMLDAVADAIAHRLPAATFGRESLDPLANDPPDRWSAAMADRYDGIVVVGGDCVTCITRGVRDAIWFDRLGKPAAVLCTAAVDDVVASVCETFGMSALRVAWVEASLFGLDRTTIAKECQPAAEQLADALVAS